jgi:hypothetical protein
MITGDALAGAKIIATESSTRLNVGARGFALWRATTGFGHKARPTFDLCRINSGSGLMLCGKNGVKMKGRYIWIVGEQALLRKDKRTNCGKIVVGEMLVPLK